MFDRRGVRLVAEMPLARIVSRVTVLLEELGDGRRLFFERILVAGGNHDGERRTDRDTPGHKRGAASRTACLTVPASEGRAFAGDPVDVRCWMAERSAAP